MAGKTDSSAPVSTKKERPEIISVSEIELELTAQIAGALIKPAAPFLLHWLCPWLDEHGDIAQGRPSTKCSQDLALEANRVWYLHKMKVGVGVVVLCFCRKR